MFFIPQKNSEKIGKFQKKYVNFRKKWKNCLKKGILFFKPKIFTSRSLKCHEIPPVVLLSTVLLKTILRVAHQINIAMGVLPEINKRSLGIFRKSIITNIQLYKYFTHLMLQISK